MTLTLLDYGAGNVTSVEHALRRLGANSHRGGTPECIAKATALLLPGVGHYEALIRCLDERGLREPLLEALRRGVPFLGICLGLQALYDGSDEAAELPGLGLLRGQVRSLPSSVKLPHMGWDRVLAKGNSRLLEGLDANAYFYFAHMYAALDSDDAVAATCDYGTAFAAVVERANICAVQFHPEKSGKAGQRVLQNFLRMCA